MLLLNEIINVDVACYLVCDFELIKTTNYLTAARHGHSKSIDSECRVSVTASVKIRLLFRL